MAEPSPTPPTFSTGVSSFPAQTERLFGELAAWLRTNSLDALIAATVGSLLFLALVGARGIAKRTLERGCEPGSWRWVAGRMVGKTYSAFLALASAQAVTGLSDAPAAWTAAVGFLFTVAAAIQLAGWARALAVSLVERRAAAHGEDDSAFDSAVGVLRVLISVAIWIVVGILLLDNLGVNVTALVAGLGIGGIAIGLAAQGIFADLFAAIAILLDKPFRRHDTISFGPPNAPTVGTVELIGLKTTRLRSPTGEQVVVGNTKLLADQIRNLRRIEARQVTMGFTLDLSATPGQLAALPGLLEGCVSRIESARFVRSVVHNVTINGFECELVFEMENPDYALTMAARQAVLLDALARLRDAGLRLARAVPYHAED